MKGKITRNLPGLIKSIVLLFVVSSLFSCATVDLGSDYLSMVNSPNPPERVIDQVQILGDVEQIDAKNKVNPYSLGRSYSVLKNNASERHHDEPILDKLLEQAKAKFPGDKVDIRNGIIGYNYSPERTVSTEFQGKVYTSVVCDSQTYYSAAVITTEPMPQPVTYSDSITLAGTQGGNVVSSTGSVIGQISMTPVTRNDIMRRTENFLDDNYKAAIARKDDFDRGRITGTYTFQVNTGQTYLITSTFTIDVLDAGTTISFTNTTLQRSPSAREEPIFLQSIADKAQTELVNFTNRLKSTITAH